MKPERPRKAPTSGMTDELRDVVERWQADRHQDAFQEIVTAYQRRMYNLAYRMLGDPEEARDAAQEIFMKVHDSLETFRFEAKFSSWIYRVAMNYLIDYRRRWLRRSADRLEDLLEGTRNHPRAAALEPEEELLRNERVAAVRAAVARLPVKLGSALVLRDLQGLSYAEISDVLGITEGTVASRLNEARKQLARRLQRTFRSDADGRR